MVGGMVAPNGGTIASAVMTCLASLPSFCGRLPILLLIYPRQSPPPRQRRGPPLRRSRRSVPPASVHDHRLRRRGKMWRCLPGRHRELQRLPVLRRRGSAAAIFLKVACCTPTPAASTRASAAIYFSRRLADPSTFDGVHAIMDGAFGVLLPFLETSFAFANYCDPIVTCSWSGDAAERYP